MYIYIYIYAHTHTHTQKRDFKTQFEVAEKRAREALDRDQLQVILLMCC